MSTPENVKKPRSSEDTIQQVEFIVVDQENLEFNSKERSAKNTGAIESDKSETSQNKINGLESSKKKKPKKKKPEEPETFVIEKILKRRRNSEGDHEFLVKWKGYSENENTWEPRSSFQDDTILKEFELERIEKKANRPDKRRHILEPSVFNYSNDEKLLKRGHNSSDKNSTLGSKKLKIDDKKPSLNFASTSKYPETKPMQKPKDSMPKLPDIQTSKSNFSKKFQGPQESNFFAQALASSSTSKLKSKPSTSKKEDVSKNENSTIFRIQQSAEASKRSVNNNLANKDKLLKPQSTVKLNEKPKSEPVNFESVLYDINRINAGVQRKIKNPNDNGYTVAAAERVMVNRCFKLHKNIMKIKGSNERLRLLAAIGPSLTAHVNKLEGNQS